MYISGDFWTYRLKGLQAHIRVVHKKVRNISCDLCDQRFVATRDKLKHMAKQHAVGIAEKWNSEFFWCVCYIHRMLKENCD